MAGLLIAGILVAYLQHLFKCLDAVVHVDTDTDEHSSVASDAGPGLAMECSGSPVTVISEELGMLYYFNSCAVIILSLWLIF